jgi:hypothetical protein
MLLIQSPSLSLFSPFLFLFFHCLLFSTAPPLRSLIFSYLLFCYLLPFHFLILPPFLIFSSIFSIFGFPHLCHIFLMFFIPCSLAFSFCLFFSLIFKFHSCKLHTSYPPPPIVLSYIILCVFVFLILIPNHGTSASSISFRFHFLYS